MKLYAYRMKALINIIKPPGPSFSYRTKFFKQLVNDQIRADHKILDLGSGGRLLHSDIVSVDIENKGNISLVCSASHLPFSTCIFQLIISTAVLEHVQDFSRTVSEIERCCCMGGLIYVEIPFLQTYHAHPHDYRRLTLPGLEQAFSKFEKIDSGVCVGPFSVLAWYLRKMPRFLVGENKVGFALEFFAGWMTFWIKYLDAIIPNARRAHQAASGVYYFGKKK